MERGLEGEDPVGELRGGETHAFRYFNEAIKINCTVYREESHLITLLHCFACVRFYSSSDSSSLNSSSTCATECFISYCCCAAVRKREIVKLTEQLLGALAAGDFETYSTLVDASCTSFQPEVSGTLIEGLDFQKFYFDFGTCNLIIIAMY